MIVRMSHDAEARLRKAVQRAVAALVKTDGIEATAARIGATGHSVRRWSEGDWPSFPNAARFAPLLGVKVAS